MTYDIVTAHYQDAILGLLVLSEIIQWYKFSHWPTRFTTARGKIAECSICHRKVANWQQKKTGVVCVNCQPTPASKVIVKGVFQKIAQWLLAIAAKPK